LKSLLGNLRQLPRTDKWLLIAVPVILVAIILVVLYGLRQSEISDQRELLFKQQTQAASERNRLEIEKQKAESEVEILRLKQQAAELSARQSLSTVRDVRAALAAVNRERVKEQKEHDKKLQGLIVNNLDACKRWLVECARAKRLQLRGANAPCECR
jgi:flagellar motility protein MotE (MotC chaperone)